MAHDELITSPEAGAILCRSARTVHRLVEAGALVPVKQLSGPNGAYLFRRADVENLAKRVPA
ncbi:MAG: helix-turn-helix domain-containing protein [Mycobacteriales bacterium]